MGSVRPKPKFRPKFRSKSAETFRPNLSVNLPKTETAKKRHFGEFLALFWLMFLNSLAIFSKSNKKFLHIISKTK